MQSNKPFDDVVAVIQGQMGSGLTVPCPVSQVLENKGLFRDSGLGELAAWLVAVQDVEAPSVAQVHICIFASSYEKQKNYVNVTDFITRASKGKAPVNTLSVDHGIGLRVLEMAPEIPHVVGESWSELECTQAVAFGMEAAAAGGHLLGLADYAPGNVAGASALITLIAEEGDLTWLQDANAADCLAATKEAMETFNRSRAAQERDPLHLLRIFGGREIAAYVGAFIAARSRNLPVLVEGYGAMAAFCVLRAIEKRSVDHIRLASCGSELERRMAAILGLQPLIGTVVEAGPGAGIALATSTLKGVVDLYI